MAAELSSWWIAVAVWEMIWKGIAMWRAAKHEQKYWFLACFVVNSAGILPLVYLWLFQKPKTGGAGSDEEISRLEPLPNIAELPPVEEPKPVPKKKVKKKPAKPKKQTKSKKPTKQSKKKK